jgi:hypothetical protein
MTANIYAEVWNVRHKSPEMVTREDVDLVLKAMRSDPRVSHVEYMGCVAQGRPAFEIRASDTQEGDLVGLFAINRCLNALSETQAGHATRVANLHASVEARVAEMRIHKAAMDAEVQEEREENLRRLKGRGINPRRLSWYVNCLARGSYVDPEDGIHDDFGWYCREIVRGRPQPMRLDLYLDGFTH